jgi:ABC-2 type transport system permease protein
MSILVAAERQRGGLAGFLRASLATAWLEYRTLRYYPANLALAAVKELTTIGVWFFVGRFLSAAASASVQQYGGGTYLAYVVVGVLLNQVGLAALTGPFTTVSDAFWDKRLETYRLAIHGIWANIVGRLAWQVLFSMAMQLAALVVLLNTGGLQLAANLHFGLILLTIALFIAANAGVGIAGASLFFLLEVKSGRDPITWLYQYLVQLATGLYVPVVLLPAWLRHVGTVLPQTYGFSAMRALVLNGDTLADPPVHNVLIGLSVATVITVTVGVVLFTVALRLAERRGGIGVVV